MKKIVLLVLVMVLAGGMALSAQTYRNELFTQDARVMAMGGFTAVANDINALFYNPAGLAYLPARDFMLGTTFYSDLSGKGIDFFADFDPDDEDFDPEDVILPLRFTSLTSRAAFAERNWGVAAVSEMGVQPIEVLLDEEEEQLDIIYVPTHNLGLVGGVGFSSGPIAVGGNIRLYRALPKFDDKTVSLGFDEDGEIKEDDLDKAMEDIRETFFAFEDDVNMEVGVGAMVTLGSLSAGAYIESLMDVLEYEDHIFERAWKSMSIGAAFTPFENRLYPSARMQLINLVIAGDFTYIGDDELRSMGIGTEVGLRLGRAVTFDLRGGYRQPMPGDFGDMEIDTSKGEVFFGLGAKLIALDLNFTAAIPAGLLEEMGEWDDEEDVVFGDYNPRFSISAGLRL